MSTGAPWRSLGEVRDREDQLEVELSNTGAAVVLPTISIGVLAFSFAGRFTLALLLALTIPIVLLTVTWRISYREPIAERRTALFGRLLSTRRFALSEGDSVAMDPVKDSPLLIVRPRWYTLSLRSSAEQKDRVIIRSNDEDELEHMAVLFNNAITRSLSARAS